MACQWVRRVRLHYVGKRVKVRKLHLVASEQKKAAMRWCVAAFSGPGGGEGSRTLDLSIANAALSQLSYAPRMCLLYERLAKVVKRLLSKRVAETLGLICHSR